MTAPPALSRLWVDGRRMPATQPVFAATDRGATLGDAVFDTALCLGGTVVFGDAHRARLIAMAEACSHRIDLDLLARAYGAGRAGDPPAVLRISISRGAAARGLAIDATATSQITAQMSPLPHGIQFSPLSLDVAEIRRNDSSPLSRMKTAGYLDAILATQTARQNGFDDALFLNTKGKVTCTTMANIFAVTGDSLVTPPIHDGALPGITRDLILKLAADTGLEPMESSLDLDDVIEADEVFLTNSLRHVVPVRNMGGTSLRARSALAQGLREEVSKQAGVTLPLPDWIDA